MKTNCRKLLFLDLEDTIITPVLTGWFNTELINVEKIKSFISEFKPDSIHIFSFAIWNNDEKAKFIQGTKPMIEAALGISISGIPTVDEDIIGAVCNVLKISKSKMDFQDLSDFYGKHDAFRHSIRNLMKHNSTPVECVLLDDAVYNEVSEWPDLHVKLRILNIDQMKEE